MRKAISYLLLFALTFSPAIEVQAATKKKPVRVQDYFINPTSDLNWMTENERAAYIAFLYSLRMMVETELSGDMTVTIEASEQRAKSASKWDVMYELLSPMFWFEEAEAVVLGVIRVAGVLIGKAFAKFGSKASKNAAEKVASKPVTKETLRQRAQNATDVEFKEVVQGTPITSKNALVPVGRNSRSVGNPKSKTEFVPGDNPASRAAQEAAEEAGKAAGKTGKFAKAGKYAKNAAGSIAVFGAGELAMSALEGDDSAESAAAPSGQSEEAAQGEGAESAAAVEASSGKKKLRKFEPMPKQEGMFCLFGGHASTYVKSGSRLICPAPEGTVNNPLCKGKGNPSFLCQDMGLSVNVKSEQVSNKLCIPLKSGRGLADLTVRCKDAFVNNFLPEVQSVSPDALQKLQEEISQGISALEKQTGIPDDIGLLEYCSDGNKVNKGRQSKPCQALLEMMEELKKYPALAKGPNSEATKPSENSAPASSDKGVE